MDIPTANQQQIMIKYDEWKEYEKKKLKLRLKIDCLCRGDGRGCARMCTLKLRLKMKGKKEIDYMKCYRIDANVDANEDAINLQFWVLLLLQLTFCGSNHRHSPSFICFCLCIFCFLICIACV